MSPPDLLVIFSWCFVGVAALLIVVPYLLGKADLLTTWNTFLLGSINFVGFAGLKAGYSPQFFRILEYTSNDYYLLMLGIVTFYTTLTLTYNFLRLPRQMAGSLPRRWPPASTGVLYLMLGISFAAGLASLSPVKVPFVSQVISQIGNKAITFGVVFAFIAWYRNRANIFLLSTLLAMIGLALMMAITAGSGRRTFVGVAAAAPLAYYWIKLRYKAPAPTLVKLSFAGAFVLLVLAGYSQLRHFDRRTGTAEGRTFVDAIEVLKELPSRMLNPAAAEELMVGQNAAQTSLAAIHLYTRQLDPEPFNAFVFVVTNPMPRAFWEGKPRGLGYTLPKDSPGFTRATWGPGIVGHGFHEGGLHMLVFYGVLAGVALRYFDELLARQPTNPYLLAMVAASSGHIAGWSRGDIGTFSIQIVGAFIAMLLFAALGRLFFGTGVVYPKTSGREFTTKNIFARPLAEPA
ncbi:MAG: hypothetical protein AAF790_04515 [Planctomycetota bacterium]